MQKKCKKMQNNLHISKKSSTFVADLGIVPTATNKYNRVMEKKCIFKCYAQGEWWYVYELNYGPFGLNYRVYRGRKWFEHSSFQLKQYAICAAVNVALCGVDLCSFKVEEKV